MILVWNDAQSFHRHLKAMRAFRQYHGANPGDDIPVRDMPTLYNIDLPRKDKFITLITDSRGRLILVPIWKIAAPPGSQN